MATATAPDPFAHLPVHPDRSLVELYGRRWEEELEAYAVPAWARPGGVPGHGLYRLARHVLDTLCYAEQHSDDRDAALLAYGAVEAYTVATSVDGPLLGAPIGTSDTVAELRRRVDYDGELEREVDRYERWEQARDRLTLEGYAQATAQLEHARDVGTASTDPVGVVARRRARALAHVLDRGRDEDGERWTVETLAARLGLGVDAVTALAAAGR